MPLRPKARMNSSPGQRPDKRDSIRCHFNYTKKLSKIKTTHMWVCRRFDGTRVLRYLIIAQDAGPVKPRRGLLLASGQSLLPQVSSALEETPSLSTIESSVNSRKLNPRIFFQPLKWLNFIARFTFAFTALPGLILYVSPYELVLSSSQRTKYIGKAGRCKPW